jgi:hypothetical protein
MLERTQIYLFDQSWVDLGHTCSRFLDNLSVASDSLRKYMCNGSQRFKSISSYIDILVFRKYCEGAN